MNSLVFSKDEDENQIMLSSNTCLSGVTKASTINFNLKTPDSSAAENGEQTGVSIDFETEIANMKAFKRAK